MDSKTYGKLETALDEVSDAMSALGKVLEKNDLEGYNYEYDKMWAWLMDMKTTFNCEEEEN